MPCASSGASSGPCPRCDGEIVERPKSYSCTWWKWKADPGCGYTLWKEVSGRTITFEEAQEYVAKGISADDIKVERVVIGPCPTPGCGGEIIERTKSYGCTSWKSRTETGCGFVIWRKAGGKEVTREEAIEMVAEGRTNATCDPLPSRSARARPRRRRHRREGAQLRLHLVQEQEEPGLRLRDLEDAAGARPRDRP